ncbi:mobilization protein, partial [Eubacterium sp. am_0171]
MEHLPVVEGKEKGFLQHRVETTASGVILAKAGRNALYRISSSRKRETNFCGCSFPKKWRTEVRESLQSRRASFYHGAKIRNSAVLPLAGNLLGS